MMNLIKLLLRGWKVVVGRLLLGAWTASGALGVARIANGSSGLRIGGLLLTAIGCLVVFALLIGIRCLVILLLGIVHDLMICCGLYISIVCWALMTTWAFMAVWTYPWMGRTWRLLTVSYSSRSTCAVTILALCWVSMSVRGLKLWFVSRLGWLSLACLLPDEAGVSGGGRWRVGARERTDYEEGYAGRWV